MNHQMNYLLRWLGLIMEKKFIFHLQKFMKINNKLAMLIAYHVIIFINLVLISYNLNLIGPAKILAWATNY